ncbi:MAG: Rrf2 family transcriptional regulator [Lachnospiraceae bacterium]|nr:Rrf2 family transcriptional regulator [Lachnospiraceae bacterium]
MHISTKCSVAIHCLIFIYEYGEKQKVTSDLLSLSTGSNPVTIRNIISLLRKDGIIAVKFGTGGATLNCPPDEITLYRICKAIEPDFGSKLIGVHALPSPLCPIGRNIHNVLACSYQKIRNDLCESLKNITLENVISDYHNMQQKLQ